MQAKTLEEINSILNVEGRITVVPFPSDTYENFNKLAKELRCRPYHNSPEYFYSDMSTYPYWGMRRKMSGARTSEVSLKVRKEVDWLN